MARNDYHTPTAKRLEYYSDFMDDFVKHPVTNELVLVTNEDAVAQSLRNIILTDLGEWPFRPYVGSNIRASLFQNYGPFMVEDLTRAISDAIKNCEPRARVQGIQIYENQSSGEVGCNLMFTTINSVDIQKLSLVLKRVR